MTIAHSENTTKISKNMSVLNLIEILQVVVGKCNYEKRCNHDYMCSYYFLYFISLPSLTFTKLTITIILYSSPYMTLSTLLILEVRSTHVIHDGYIFSHFFTELNIYQINIYHTVFFKRVKITPMVELTFSLLFQLRKKVKNFPKVVSLLYSKVKLTPLLVGVILTPDSELNLELK